MITRTKRVTLTFKLRKQKDRLAAVSPKSDQVLRLAAHFSIAEIGVLFPRLFLRLLPRY
jgi:hypothetical protein